MIVSSNRKILNLLANIIFVLIWQYWIFCTFSSTQNIWKYSSSVWNFQYFFLCRVQIDFPRSSATAMISIHHNISKKYYLIFLHMRLKTRSTISRWVGTQSTMQLSWRRSSYELTTSRRQPTRSVWSPFVINLRSHHEMKEKKKKCVNLKYHITSDQILRVSKSLNISHIIWNFLFRRASVCLRILTLNIYLTFRRISLSHWPSRIVRDSLCA